MGAAETEGLTGSRYGRYELLFKIASGGMAEVCGARLVGEGGFEKMVALKRMLPTLAEDDRFVAMFLDEGKLAAQIASPHVVQTLDLGRAEDDSLFLVMELVVGVSLSVLLRSCARAGSAVPTLVAVEILAQAAQGLDDAHEARSNYGEPLSLVHRDISPQNVMVDVGGRTRITDFGVARALERITHTQSGEIKGKLSYFSPEQAEGVEVDRRSDIFALGIVAWELLAMRRLFAGDSPAQCLNRVMNLKIPRLDEIDPAIPAGVADAVAKTLERDREKRTATAAEFARELRAAIAPCPRAEIVQFVRRHGGEPLAKIEAGMRSAARTAPASAVQAFRTSSPGSLAAAPNRAEPGDDDATTVTPPTGSFVSMDATRSASKVRRSASGALDATGALLDIHVEAVDTLAPTASPAAFGGSASTGAPSARRGPLAVAAIVAAALVMTAALAMLVASRGGRGDGASPQASPIDPVSNGPSAGAAPAGAARSPAAAIPTATPPAAAAPPLAPNADGSPSGEGPGRAGVRGSIRRPSGAHSAEPAGPRPQAASDPTPARAEVRPERPAPATPRAPSRTAPSTAPRPEALRGLDDFERELGP